MGSTMDKIKGKAKEMEGRATGDKTRTRQGKVEKAKGNIKGAAGRATSRVRSGVNRATSKSRTSKTRSRSRAGA